MKEYSFDEATPLIDFIQKNRDRIIGKTLNNFYSEQWLYNASYLIIDRPIVLAIDDYCVEFGYFLESDITFKVGKIEEFMQNKDIASIIQSRNECEDYFGKKECTCCFESPVERKYIEGCKITDIKVDRFSDAFEYTVQGDVRPEGGDYFSTISLYLDSGVILSFCAESAISDGYMRIWC